MWPLMWPFPPTMRGKRATIDQKLPLPSPINRGRRPDSSLFPHSPFSPSLARSAAQSDTPERRPRCQAAAFRHRDAARLAAEASPPNHRRRRRACGSASLPFGKALPFMLFSAMDAFLLFSVALRGKLHCSCPSSFRSRVLGKDRNLRFFALEGSRFPAAVPSFFPTSSSSFLIGTAVRQLPPLAT